MAESGPKATFESSFREGGSPRQTPGSSLLLQAPPFIPPSSWESTIERKMVSFPCVIVQQGFFWSDNFKSIIPLVKKLGMRGASAIIKTWANAWATSSRMHEADVLPCIFGCGCGEVDSLEHYLSCDPLWTIVISCSLGDKELLQVSPATKLGFGPSSFAWLQRSVCCFQLLSCYQVES